MTTMSPPKTSSPVEMCEHVLEAELTLYLDQQLNSEEAQQLEVHISGCAECTMALQHAQRAHTLLNLLPEPTLSDTELEAARRRDWNVISERIDQELREARLEQSALERLMNPMRGLVATLKRRFSSVMIASLSVAVVFLATTGFKSTLVDFVVSSHEQAWPSEVSPSELHQVEAWFSTHSEGGEPLKVPHFDRLAGAGVHLEVARLSLAMVGPERWERTAHLVYRFQESKQRLTVVAFQGSPEALSEGDVRVIEGVEVKVIERGSLRVASYRRGGLSYMLTSDLHTDELLKLIGADLKSAREGLHAQ